MSPGSVPAIVVRAGEMGAFTLSRDWTGWVPAFWQLGDEAHIRDVTGGGNAFLGGLLAGLFITQGDFRIGGYFS
jgi:sugar/nucleoside kinase (ribokinase family)